MIEPFILRVPAIRRAANLLRVKLAVKGDVTPPLNVRTWGGNRKLGVWRPQGRVTLVS